MTRVPVRNDTDREILIGLEPEGDTIPLAPGETCLIQTAEDAADWDALDFHIEYSEGLVSISLMCEKLVFVNGRRVR